MAARYLIRLDDACPTMDSEKWDWFENLFDEFNIKPIMAVVPQNNDPLLKIREPDPKFWEKVRRWQAKEYEIALHGYDHVFTTTYSGIVPLNNFSEFAGLPLRKQQEKIRNGIKMFSSEGINTRVWVAPAHSFDKNTLLALTLESNIGIISDGINLGPYYKHDFLWIPQQLWAPEDKNAHVWTICFHPNTMNAKIFDQLRGFVKHNALHFSSVQEILEAGDIGKMTIPGRLCSEIFFWKRNIKWILQRTSKIGKNIF